MHATVFTNYIGPMDYANTLQVVYQDKSNNNTLLDRKHTGNI